MADIKETLKKIPKLGNAKIAGLVCNKKAPMILRLDLEIPADEFENALDVLGLESTDEVVDSLEKALAAIKKQRK
jgi:hypothetical protein